MNNALKDKINKIRAEYNKNKCVLIRQETVLEIIKQLGATDEDINDFYHYGEYLASDPTLSYRQSRTGRYLFDNNEKTISRLEYQPFVLTEEDGFIREDSGKQRHFRGLDDRWQNNTAYQGMLKLNLLLMQNCSFPPRHQNTETRSQLLATAFHIKMNAKPNSLSELSIEGVHQDGVDHTMITMMNKHNVKDSTGTLRVHSLAEPFSVPWDKVDPNKILLQNPNAKYLDTLLVADSLLNHSGTPIFNDDNSKPADLDLFLLLSRYPRDKSHPSYKFDSMRLHPDLPLTLKLTPEENV